MTPHIPNLAAIWRQDGNCHRKIAPGFRTGKNEHVAACGSGGDYPNRAITLIVNFPLAARGRPWSAIIVDAFRQRG